MKFPFFKILFLISIFCLKLTLVQAQNPYVTVWKTNIQSDNEDEDFDNSSEDDQIQFMAEGNFDYTWEEVDEDFQTLSNMGEGVGQNGLFTLTFSAPGLYRLKIFPTGEDPLQHHYFIPNSFGDPAKLLRIEQWGDVEWSSWNFTFFGTENLEIVAEDLPDLSQVTEAVNAFANSGISVVPLMNEWDVSQIEDMDSFFSGANNFNTYIGDWDVSQVTNFAHTFENAFNFNQPIGNWEVGNLTDMTAMFYKATSFNQPIGDWDVSQVTTMNDTFMFAESFNQPIGNWDVSQVETMFATFAFASSFDQPLADWDVSSVWDMQAMFFGATIFNQPIGDWDVSNVIDMSTMFAATDLFNQPIGNWDVGNVTRTQAMFSGALNFQQDISNWNVSNVYNMNSMFGGARFDMPIGNWDVSNVIDMGGMFEQNKYFNQPIGDWDVSRVGVMKNMFFQAVKFNQPLNDWDVADVFNMSGIFHRAIAFNQALPDWNLKKLISTEIFVDVDDATVTSSFSFAHSGMSCEHYSETLQGWANNPETSNRPITLVAEGIQYSEEIESSRDNLIEDLGWTIMGDEAGNCTLDIKMTNLDEIYLYPNPTSDFVFIKGLNGNEQMSLYDFQGRKLSVINSNSIDLTNYAKGIYFIKIFSENQREVVFKVVKY